ncbi:MAG: alpha/beta hydrolase-fold protein [Phycisphaerae bacterium]
MGNRTQMAGFPEFDRRGISGHRYAPPLKHAAVCCVVLAAIVPAASPAMPPAARAPASAPSHEGRASAVRQFSVTFARDFLDRPYTGRVWVMTARSSRREPRFGPNWFNPTPMFAVEVVDWAPETPLVLGENALAYPAPISESQLDGLRVQAVMAVNPDARKPGTGAGDGYSDVLRLDADAVRDQPIPLRITNSVKPRPFRGTGRIRPFEIVSRGLTKFHGREIRLTAAVILPAQFDEATERRFPTLYIFPGFGQTRWTAPMYVRPTHEGETQLVQVLLDGDCATGVHQFADSAVNGPYGQALVEELIPALEMEFRLIPEATARFLTGHSSGGWASLWAQITHPDYFGGVWATSPDPVDFRHLVGVNIYETGANVFRDAAGQPRPLARRTVGGDDKVIITWKQFSDMDRVVGRGEQLGSLQAVFSPRGPDGGPAPLYDRMTGAVDPAVAKAWEKYDVRLVLERGWQRLAARLKGKIHVYAGSKDTFYLEGAVRLLKASLSELESDADIRILDGYDHSTIMRAPELRGIHREIAKVYRRHHSEDAGS